MKILFWEKSCFSRKKFIWTRFFWLSNFCDHEIVKNNKNEHLWSLNSQKDVIILQEVKFIDIL